MKPCYRKLAMVFFAILAFLPLTAKEVALVGTSSTYNGSGDTLLLNSSNGKTINIHREFDDVLSIDINSVRVGTKVIWTYTGSEIILQPQNGCKVEEVYFLGVGVRDSVKVGSCPLLPPAQGAVSMKTTGDSVRVTWSGSASSELKLTFKYPVDIKNYILIRYNGEDEKQEFVPNFTDLTLNVGDSRALSLPTDAPAISYATSQATVAVVQNNSVVATGAGVTTITATWNETDKWKSGSASFKVTVNALTPEKQEFVPNFTDLTLNVGDSRALGLPTDAPAISYATSQATVAVVQNNSVVATGAGVATITATWNETDKWKSGSASFKVTVNAPTPEKQEFAPNFADLTLNVGDSRALGLPTDAPAMSYTTSQATVAVVVNNAVVAKGVGETTITATWNETDKWKSGSSSFKVTVNAPAPEKQEFVPNFTDLTLNVGDSRALGLPTDAPAISYATSQATVAVVQNNSVVATGAGETTITATWNETDKWKSGTASFKVTVNAPALEKQEFVPNFTDLTLNVGDSRALGLPTDAPAISYATSQATVAVVQNNSVVATGAGETTITATWNETDKWKSGSASFKVTVSAPTPEKQEFVPNFTDLTLNVGDSRALGLPTDAPAISYATSQAAVAIIENNSVVAKGAGETTITATWNETDKWKSGTASFKVTVNAPAPEKQEFVPNFTDLTLNVGDSRALGLPTDAPAMSYTTSQATVAVVENNAVVAKGAGETTITATWNETDKWKAGSASFKVTVNAPAPEKQEFVPNFTDLTLNVGDSRALGLPTDAPPISYATSQATVAVVQNNSVVAKGAGETTITATWNETDKWKSGSASFKVTVRANPGEPVDPQLTFQHSLVRGQIGWGAISQAAIYRGDGILRYTSSDPNVAEVDALTGVIKNVKREGQTIIQATLSATSQYKAANASYTLQIEAAPTDKNLKFDRITSGGFARTTFTVKKINKNYVQYTVDGLKNYEYKISIIDDILEVNVRIPGIYTLRASAADGTGNALMQLIIFPPIEITPTYGEIDPDHQDVVLFDEVDGSVKIKFEDSPIYKVSIDGVPFTGTEIPVRSDMAICYTLQYASMPFSADAWIYLVIRPFSPKYEYDADLRSYIIKSDVGHILYKIGDAADWTDTHSDKFILGSQYFGDEKAIDIRLITRKSTARPGYEASSGMATFNLPSPETLGVEDVTIDSQEPELYDLNGRRVTTPNPQPGIYIMKYPNKTVKIKL